MKRWSFDRLIHHAFPNPLLEVTNLLIRLWTLFLVAVSELEVVPSCAGADCCGSLASRSWTLIEWLLGRKERKQIEIHPFKDGKTDRRGVEWWTWDLLTFGLRPRLSFHRKQFVSLSLSLHSFDCESSSANRLEVVHNDWKPGSKSTCDPIHWRDHCLCYSLALILETKQDPKHTRQMSKFETILIHSSFIFTFKFNLYSHSVYSSS